MTSEQTDCGSNNPQRNQETLANWLIQLVFVVLLTFVHGTDGRSCKNETRLDLLSSSDVCLRSFSSGKWSSARFCRVKAAPVRGFPWRTIYLSVLCVYIVKEAFWGNRTWVLESFSVFGFIACRLLMWACCFSLAFLLVTDSPLFLPVLARPWSNFGIFLKAAVTDIFCKNKASEDSVKTMLSHQLSVPQSEPNGDF